MTTKDNTAEPATEEVAALAPIKSAPKKQTESFENKTPSLWDIKPTDEDGMITAFSSSTQERFEGTMAEFNARLK